MNQFLPLMLLYVLLIATAFAESPSIAPFSLPVTNPPAPNYDDDRDYANFVGRLYIDAIDIDVALYHSNSQEVVDRKDSAAYFDLSSARGNMIIADHNTHAFADLGTVKKGAIAHLEKENGIIEYYECIAVFKGHNTGKGITDWNGNSVVGQAELMMYTCFDGWQNIWVVLWEKQQSPEEMETQQLLNRFGASMERMIHELLLNTREPPSIEEACQEIELILQAYP